MRKLTEVMNFHLFVLVLILNTCVAGCAVANVKGEDTPTGETLNMQEAKNEEIKVTEITKNANNQETNKETSIVLTNSEQPDKDTVLKELSMTKALNATEDLMLGGNDELIENEIKRLMLEFGENEKVPQVFFNEVKGYIQLFRTNYQYKKFTNASLKRSSRYMTSVKGILTKKGIPEDMAYIAFIESGFNPRALSHAGAMGMWQFMPGTARNYSLNVSTSIDERLNPLKSTYAAVDYFHDLLAIFGPRSFLLAMAAYNGGEGKIISCLKRIENPFEERNFWHIRPCLSKETREYPPKIIAASIIGNNPEAFGFPKYEESQDEFISEAFTAEYNPSRTKARVVPAVYSKPLSRQTEVSQDSVRHYKKSAKRDHRKPVIYVVKQGNKLDAVAEVFEVETVEIKKWNKLKNGRLAAGQKLTIYPDKAFETVAYSVKKGDTITEISEAFRVRPSHIVTCIALKNGWNIKVGQKLTFYRTADKKPVIYAVKKGATLTQIASKHGVKVREIVMWNNLNTTTVYSGQKLKIYQKSA